MSSNWCRLCYTIQITRQNWFLCGLRLNLVCASSSSTVKVHPRETDISLKGWGSFKSWKKLRTMIHISVSAPLFWMKSASLGGECRVIILVRERGECAIRVPLILQHSFYASIIFTGCDQDHNLNQWHLNVRSFEQWGLVQRVDAPFREVLELGGFLNSTYWQQNT